MNEKQRRFCDEYILNGGDGAKAARAAGYSDNGNGAKVTASRLLNNLEVKAYIDERLKAASTESVLSETALLEFLSSVVRGEVEDEQLMTRLIGKGCSVIERHKFRCSTKDKIRAVELLLRLSGAFRRAEQPDTNGAQIFIAAVQRAWGKNNADDDNIADYNAN